MSREVEQRVVNMMFNNQSFESSAKKTLNTLSQLAEKLHVLEGLNGLTNLGKAAAQLPLDALSSAAGHFETLIVKATFLNRIIGDLYGTIKRTFNDLAIAPMTTGFAEYEEKMGAVQTILLSSGKSLDVVKDRLEELNLYADRTIYSFSDMTKSIAKFTNAGVDLDVAVKAIQGISNEAAVSGATAAEASRAMYNISQALSMGYMQYIDWKSIENANMATVEFKQNLVNTAVAMGTLTQEEIDAQNGIQSFFKDKMKDGWLTNEVLLTTLQMYTDETTELGKKAKAAAQEVRTFSMLMDTLKEAAQSGWGQTWEIIIGDYNESKALFTRISKAISGIMDDSANARNALLREWKDLGGRDSIIEAVATAFNNVRQTVGAVKRSFESVFPRLTAIRLKEATDAIAGWLTKLKLSEKQTAVLQRVAKGAFSGFKIVIDSFKQIKNAAADVLMPAIKRFASPAIKLISNVFQVASALIQKFSEHITKNKVVYEFFSNVFGKALGVIGNAFDRLRSYLSGFHLPTWLQEIVDWGKSIFSIFEGKSLGEIIDDIFKFDFGKEKKKVSSMQGVLSTAETVGATVQTLAEVISDVIRGDYGNGLERIQKLQEKFTDPSMIQPGVNQVWSREGDWIEGAEATMTEFANVEVQAKGALPGLLALDDFYKRMEESRESIENAKKIKGSTGVDSIDGVIYDPNRPSFIKSLQELFTTGLPTAFAWVRDKFAALIEWFKENGPKLDYLFGMIFNEIRKIVNGIPGVISAGWNAITGLFNGIIGFVEAMTGWDLHFPTLDEIIEFFENIDEFKASIPTRLESIKNAIVSFIENATGIDFKMPDWHIFDGFLEELSAVDGGVLKKLGFIGDKIVEFLRSFIGNGDIKQIGENVKNNAVSSILESITGFVKNAKSAIQSIFSFITSIPSRLSKINLAQIFHMALGGIVAFGSGKAVFSLTKAFGHIGDLADMLVGNGNKSILDRIKEAFEAIKNKFKDASDQTPEIIKKTSKMAKIVLIVGMISLITFSIYTIVSSIEKLGKLTNGQLGRGLLGYVAVIAMMLGTFKLVEHMWKNTDMKTVSKLTSISAAISVFAFAINSMIPPILSLGNLPLPKLIQGGVAVTVLVAVMLGVMYAMVQMMEYTKDKNSSIITKKPGANKLIGASFALMLLVDALILVTIPIIALGLMPLTKVIQGGVAATVIFGVFVAITYALTKILGNVGGGTIGKMVAVCFSMLPLVLAIDMISIPIIALGLLPLNKLAQGMVGIIGAIAAMFIIAKIMSKIDFSKSTLVGIGLMVSVAISLTLLSVPIMILGLFPWEKGVQGLIGVIAAVGVLYFVSKALKSIDVSWKSIAAIIALSASLVVISLPIIMLGSIPWTSLAQGLGGLVLAAGALWLGSKILSKISFNPMGALALAAFGLALIPFAVGLTMLGTAASMIGDRIVEVVVLVGVVIGLAFAVKLISGVAVAPMLALSAAIVAFAVAISLLGLAMNSFDKGAVMSLGSDMIRGLVKGLMEAMHWLLGVPKKIWNLIVGGIKNLFGIQSPSTVMAENGEYMIEGLGEGLTNGLPSLKNIIGNIGKKIGDWFKNFFTPSNLKSMATKAIDAGKNLASSIANGVKSGFNKMVALGSKVISSIQTGISNFMTSHGFENAWDVLAWIGNGIRNGFNKAVNVGKDILNWIVNGVKNAFHAVVGFGKSIVDWVVDNITHWMSYMGFENGKDILDWIVNGVKNAFNTVIGIGKDIIDWVVNAATNWMTSMGFENGADILNWVGDGIKNAFNAVLGVGKDILVWIRDTIVGAFKKVTNVGSKILNWIVDHIVSAFSFVTSIGMNILGWISDSISSWMKTMGFADANDVLYWIGSGIRAAFTKVVDIGGDILGWIVDAIKGAALGLYGVVYDVGQPIIDWLDNAISDVLSGDAFDGKGILTWISDGIVSLFGSITSIGSSIVSWITGGISEETGENASEYDGTSILTWITTGIGNKIETIITSGANLVHSFVAGILGETNAETHPFENLVDICDWVRKGILAGFSTIADVGTKLINRFTRGILDYITVPDGHFEKFVDVCLWVYNGICATFSRIWDAASELVNEFVTDLKDGTLVSQVVQAGADIASGFWQGVTSFGKPAGWEKDLTNGALDTLNKFWDINSPSKVTRKIGEYIAQGLTDGINNGGPGVISAIESTNVEAKNAMAYMLGDIYSFLNSDMNIDPTIRPVLDLSNVHAGVRTMDEWFGTGGVQANVSMRAASMISNDHKPIDMLLNSDANNNEGLEASLLDIKNELVTLKNAINGMQVVMDNGALVGSISTKMDQALARNAMYKRRGM